MIDRAKIFISAGKGGDGLVSFRREKYVPKGGPDGGDGGNGGNIILVATRNLNTLFDHNRQKKYQAENGAPGGPSKKTGKNGKDLVIHLPVGTIVRNEDNKKIADLTKDGQELLVARGGKGGRGNIHFSSSTNRVPRTAEKGEAGQAMTLYLDLKLMADVGLIGLPNSGKSTLLATISQAQPKIADYPFTTLEPVIGIVKHKGITFAVADIPGLISGAASGKGLGHRFLKHIERTKILVHLVSAESKDLLADAKIVRNELVLFSKRLAKKPCILVISKSDLDIKSKANSNKLEGAQLEISATNSKNIDKLLDLIISYL